MFKKEALEKADLIDKKIIEVLIQKKNFRVEAGAGSGKTYSLMKVIDWLQDNKINEFNKTGSKVACLTFTNAAVDVINSRLKENSFIIPSTIHSFAWSVMKQFQNSIIDFMDKADLLPKDCKREAIKKVNYTLGSKYLDADTFTLYLGHADIIKLFSIFLDNKKFRDILTIKYPIILIDEYQDSNKEIIEKFILYFINPNLGIQFGFFGDSWQTIYQTNNACGLIENQNLLVINKEINFRSTQKIVDILNIIRPSLPQQSAVEENNGRIVAISTNEFTGIRRTDRNFKDDLPQVILEEYVENIKAKIKENQLENEKLKVLMLTHRILAEQQGYTELLQMLGDGKKDGDDELLCYIRDFVEPLRKAIIEKNVIKICEVLKTNKLYAIEKKSDKKQWTEIVNLIQSIETKSIIDVLSLLEKRLPIHFPESIMSIYNQMIERSEEKYQNTTYSQLSNVRYSEFVKASDFISIDSNYSTDHGVKGKEYDSVLFVIGAGWNLYQFDKYMPMLESDIPDSNRKAHERNRNLFYVCCSRAKKNLYLFITIPLSSSFRNYLINLVGSENLIEYNDFINN